MNREVKICDECESEYYADTSEMPKLCPDCSHHLYGCKNCNHNFEDGRCTNCYWNGNSTSLIKGLKKDKEINANWTPISVTELTEVIKSAVSKMTDNQLVIWNEITTKPKKWTEEEYGKEGGGFWVIAIDGNEVIWYNDIEEGFNISNFTAEGEIDEYGAELDELQWAINKLKRYNNTCE